MCQYLAQLWMIASLLHYQLPFIVGKVFSAGDNIYQAGSTRIQLATSFVHLQH